MANDLVYVYPRGYLSFYTNSAPPEQPVDLMKTTAGILVQYIDGIYGIDTTFNSNDNTMIEKVLEGIKLGRNLFGEDFNRWLELQLTSPTITSDGLAFIEDTVSFITTGKRIIPIESAYRTNRDVERSRYNTEKLKYVGDLKFNDPNTVSILCDWLAQPGGIRDFRCTLEILFGDEHVVDRVIKVQPKPGVMYF